MGWPYPENESDPFRDDYFGIERETVRVGEEFFRLDLDRQQVEVQHQMDTIHAFMDSSQEQVDRSAYDTLSEFSTDPYLGEF